MYEGLKSLDVTIKSRYDTLEKDLKSKSNSFYDAYIDLVECFSKYVAESLKIKVPYNVTCGKLLCFGDYRNKYLKELNCSENVYFKLQNLILECNEHKHDTEKLLNFDDVCEYLKCLFDYANYYLDYKKIDICIFDRNYFNDLYLTEETQKGREDFIINKIDSLEEKIKELNKNGNVFNARVVNKEKAVENFFEKAIIRVFYSCYADSLSDTKTKFSVLFFAYIFIAIATTIISSINFKIYSTFTLFENIYLIMQMVYSIRLLKLGDETSQIEYMDACNTTFYKNKYGVYVSTNKVKSGYKIFRNLNYIAIVLNIISSWILAPGLLSILVTVLEIGLFALNVVLSLKRDAFLMNYCDYGFLGPNGKGEQIKIFVNNLIGKFMSEEEYNDLRKKDE